MLEICVFRSSRRGHSRSDSSRESHEAVISVVSQIIVVVARFAGKKHLKNGAFVYKMVYEALN